MKPDLTWLEDPEVFQVNRLDAHSDHHYYESEIDMENGRESFRQSLNGTWRFAWSRNPGERPADFYKEDADISGFGEIQVPGHIELQGYDKVHYINNMYPWEGHAFLRPPHIDWEFDPVGSYVKEFDLEEGLLGKRICISFQGAEQAVYVWLNGEFIGYAEDSFTPSEFDLTESIKEKGNRLCVEVYKRSSAAWIEDQDFFRFSGLFRDVYLYAKPETHVEDLWVKAGLLDDYETGTLEVLVKLSGNRNARLEWLLQDCEQKTVADGLLEEKQADVWKTEPVILKKVEKWEAGEPYLYRLLVKITDTEGRLVEIVPYSVGFRRFELKDRIMLLNGKRLIIKGVNRHEWNPRRGRSITADDMKKDIEILKKNNINAVRTCHYPNQSLWYQLCDEAGICVMDEANLESHGSWQKMGQCEPSWNVPGSRSEWEKCVVDRAASMLERDKNHPSILWWSCGNESYAGTCILAMSRYFHEKDSSRLVHYEGVFWNREFDEISDVESRMYAVPEDIRKYLENDPQKPFLLCEYMHDMGNSLGGMESYIRLQEEYPMYQGGFIWDLIDQAIYHKNQYGEEVLGYGGDFLDRPTDYSFSGNGLLFADRREKPAMQEVRYWYSDEEKRNKIRERNKALRSQAEERIRGWKAESREKLLASDSSGMKFQVIHSDLMLGIKGDGFHFIFSYVDGGPVSIVYNGTECLYRAPKPAFWRASTENDKGNGFPARSGVWLTADQFAVCRKCLVTEYAGNKVMTLEPSDLAGRKPAAEDLEKVKITYTFATGTVPETEAIIDYTVDKSGKIQVDAEYKGREGLPELPLFGVRFVMPEKLETVEWEGLSGETYPDRKVGGVFGTHRSPVTEPDHLVPQEYGNHADTCWARTGEMCFVMNEKPFHFSAVPFTAAELENALHKEELPKTGRTVVNILGAMRGVGGIDSWGSDVEPQYHVSGEEDIRFSFFITSTDCPLHEAH